MRAEQHVVGEIFLLISGVRKVPISIVEALQTTRAIEVFATGGSFEADFNLLVQVAMGVALMIGALLARAKRYAAHGICQSAVLLLNVALIAGIMWPSFSSQVLPVLPNHLTDSYYGVASAHGVMAASAELFGLYLLLVAGTDLLPARLRVQRLKLWMRVELGLWWIGIITGILTYFVWYAGAS